MIRHSILFLFVFQIAIAFGQPENIIADHYKTKKFNVAIFQET